MARYATLMLTGFVIFCIVTLFTGCGSKNNVKLEGTATVNHVISIDFEIMMAFCENSFEEIEDVEQCKKDMLELLTNLAILTR